MRAGVHGQRLRYLSQTFRSGGCATGRLSGRRRSLVGHAPAQLGSCGTLEVESRRHVLDFGDLNATEAETLGLLLRRLYAVLKVATGAERIYTLATMEGAPHLHLWLVPRLPDLATRGVALLATARSCSEDDVVAIAQQLRVILNLTP